MFTRSMAKTDQERKDSTGRCSTTSSTRAAQRLALEAEHAKRLVEIERFESEQESARDARIAVREARIAAAERAASEKELEAQIAALSSRSSQSSRRSTVDRWLDAAVISPPSNPENATVGNPLLTQGNAAVVNPVFSQGYSNLPFLQVGDTVPYNATLEARATPQVDASPLLPGPSRLVTAQVDISSLGQSLEPISIQPPLAPSLRLNSEPKGTLHAVSNLSRAPTPSARYPCSNRAHSYAGFEDHQPPMRFPLEDRIGYNHQPPMRFPLEDRIDTTNASPIYNDVSNFMLFSCSSAQEPAPPRPEVVYSRCPISATLTQPAFTTHPPRPGGATHAPAPPAMHPLGPSGATHAPMPCNYVRATCASALPRPEVVCGPHFVAATSEQPVPTATAPSYAPRHTLGTHHANFYNKDNKDSSKTDTLRFTEAFAEIAATAATKAARNSKVSPLPFFDGRPTDWLVFKRVYGETSPSLSPSENIARLSFALRGAARDAVAIMLAATRDPQDIIRHLETAFARPEQIILAELCTLRALPKLSSDSAKELNSFALKVSHCLQVVKLLNRTEYLASPELCDEILLKLTPILRAFWGYFAKQQNHCKYKLELLADFLLCEADQRVKYGVLERPKLVTKVSCHTAIATPVSRPSNQVKGSAPIAIPRCLFCSKGHYVRECKRFQALSEDERWEWVHESKVCHKCLEKGSHQYKRCRKFACKERPCKYPCSHHTLLHRVPRVEVAHVAEEVAPAPSSLPCSDTSVVVAHNWSPCTKRPLLKIVPVTLYGPKGDFETHALLDDGSTATLLDASVAEALGVEGRRSRIRVEGVGGMTTETEVSFVDVEIKGRHASESYNLRGVRAIPNLNLKSQSVEQLEVRQLKYLTDICDEVCYEDARPTLLIGVDNWELTVPFTIRRGTRTQPVAALTSLGWVLYGSLKSKSSPTAFVNHCSVSEHDVDSGDASLDAQLREYFRVDSIGISTKTYHSPMDELAIRTLENTTRRLPSGRFETGLIWKPNIGSVPDSYGLAHSRFLSLERKMSRDQAYAEAYRNNINAMIEKGYAEICDGKPIGTGVVWYLPHFGVVHPQKRKLRVVHDAAAKSLGVSLNSLLLPGPDLLQPLLSILMRFREGRVALNADIREMFPQTKIRQEDRDAQRFLWRPDPSRPIREYRMASMMFGATSSPCTANYLKNRNAEEHRAFFPNAADAIIGNHYCDDYLGSLNSTEEAARLAVDIVHVHAQASLEMRSWISNSREALVGLPPDLLAPSSPPPVVRILGVIWDVNTDTLQFARNSLLELPKKLTKRSVLAHLMRTYDPLGLLTPVVVKGRVIFQRTWKLGIDWDDELPPRFVMEWERWSRELSDLLNGSIPRHYLRSKSAHRAELHVFADASELSYACVAYWRFECEGGDVMLSLIGGKARLAPLKPLSIPRLELQAALIAARFAAYVVEAHVRKPDKTFFWSDSLTVLKWLRSDARSYKTFVAHRLGEISEITNVADWRYVPSALNIADDATRISQKFETSSRWFSGPSFLNLPPADWPPEPSITPAPVPEEMKGTRSTFCLESVACTSLQFPALPNPVVADASRFSGWLRLLRATARTLKCANIFMSSCRVVLPPNRGPCSPLDLSALAPLTSEDLEKAERLLLLRSQLNTFGKEYAHILRRERLPNGNRFRRLTLQLCQDGLLCLSGRITTAEDRSVSNQPAILDGRERIAQLLIAYHHKRAAHGFNELVVNELKQKYYIVGLRPAVRQVASRCITCRLAKERPCTPPIGDLPAERLASHCRPFTFTGLDYFGPLTITVARHTEKRYVALFTCLTVRAVHLEVVNDLSADSAIMALRRFIARRGVPNTIWSDNGTAFVGANRLLAVALAEFTTERGIRWKFITPASPFMGGAWERLVRTVKTALTATLHQRSPKEDVLTTLLAEAEGLVNSRPLTHVAVDPEAPEAITPFHFLLGASSPYSRVANVTDDDLIRRARWKKGLRLADHFWSRWVKEYLPTLVPRTNVGPTRPVSEGDLVLVADGNLPRGTWPKGRVAKTFPGKDGVVRSVEIRTSTGVLKRPVRRLVVLSNLSKAA